ncbi:MAG: hypothetical protein QXI16_04540 [Sulfolobaceae archaeon]
MLHDEVITEEELKSFNSKRFTDASKVLARYWNDQFLCLIPKGVKKATWCEQVMNELKFDLSNPKTRLTKTIETDHIIANKNQQFKYYWIVNLNLENSTLYWHAKLVGKYSVILPKRVVTTDSKPPEMINADYYMELSNLPLDGKALFDTIGTYFRRPLTKITKEFEDKLLDLYNYLRKHYFLKDKEYSLEYPEVTSLFQIVSLQNRFPTLFLQTSQLPISRGNFVEYLYNYDSENNEITPEILFFYGKILTSIAKLPIATYIE